MSYSDHYNETITDITNVNMSNDTFHNCILNDIVIDRCDLSGADFYNCTIKNVTFMDCNMSAVAIDATNTFESVRFSCCRLSSARVPSSGRYNYCYGNLSNLLSLQIQPYTVNMTPENMSIGCTHFPIQEWWDMSQESIYDLDGARAVEWWRQWKGVLKQIWEAHYGE